MVYHFRIINFIVLLDLGQMFQLVLIWHPKEYVNVGTQFEDKKLFKFSVTNTVIAILCF